MKKLKLINHNNKLNCKFFGVIAPAPTCPTLESELMMKFIVEDIEGIIPPFVAERISLTLFFLNEIPMFCSLTANEAYPDEIIESLIKQYKCTIDTQFAYYLFKKI